MTTETFLSLCVLAVATLFTPGPNNAMLATSGANFGFRRTVPHLVGVALGFPLMLLLIGFLLGGLFQTSALLREVLRWGGALILLWIAWKTATAGGPKAGGKALKPMTFMQAVAFQWINPKGWSMAVAATSQYILPGAPVRTALITALVFAVLGFGSAALWAYGGRAIARWLTTDRRLRAFNITMAILIVISILGIVGD